MVCFKDYLLLAAFASFVHGSPLLKCRFTTTSAPDVLPFTNALDSVLSPLETLLPSIPFAIHRRFANSSTTSASKPLATSSHTSLSFSYAPLTSTPPGSSTSAYDPTRWPESKHSWKRTSTVTVVRTTHLPSPSANGDMTQYGGSPTTAVSSTSSNGESSSTTSIEPPNQPLRPSSLVDLTSAISSSQYSYTSSAIVPVFPTPVATTNVYTPVPLKSTPSWVETEPDTSSTQYATSALTSNSSPSISLSTTPSSQKSQSPGSLSMTSTLSTSAINSSTTARDSKPCSSSPIPQVTIIPINPSVTTMYFTTTVDNPWITATITATATASG